LQVAQKTGEAIDDNNYIHTVSGRSYVLRIPMEEVEAPAA
jgi:hypothetical protein